MRLQELAHVQNPADAEIEQYYNSHQKEFWQGERAYFARTIFKKSGATDEAGIEIGTEVARKKAVAFREKLLSGDVDSIAGMSEAKWYEISSLRPELAKAISTVGTSGLSDVIETSDSFSILRVLDKENARPKTLAETTTEISKTLSRNRLNAAEERWYQTLRSKAVIERAPLPHDL